MKVFAPRSGRSDIPVTGAPYIGTAVPLDVFVQEMP